MRFCKHILPSVYWRFHASWLTLPKRRNDNILIALSVFCANSMGERKCWSLKLLYKEMLCYINQWNSSISKYILRINITHRHAYIYIELLYIVLIYVVLVYTVLIYIVLIYTVLIYSTHIYIVLIYIVLIYRMLLYMYITKFPFSLFWNYPFWFWSNIGECVTIRYKIPSVVSVSILYICSIHSCIFSSYKLYQESCYQRYQALCIWSQSYIYWYI